MFFSRCGNTWHPYEWVLSTLCSNAAVITGGSLSKIPLQAPPTTKGFDDPECLERSSAIAAAAPPPFTECQDNQTDWQNTTTR